MEFLTMKPFGARRKINRSSVLEIKLPVLLVGWHEGTRQAGPTHANEATRMEQQLTWIPPLPYAVFACDAGCHFVPLS